MFVYLNKHLTSHLDIIKNNKLNLLLDIIIISSFSYDVQTCISLLKHEYEKKYCENESTGTSMKMYWKLSYKRIIIFKVV